MISFVTFLNFNSAFSSLTSSSTTDAVRTSLERLSTNASLVRDRVLVMEPAKQQVFLKVLQKLEKALTVDKVEAGAVEDEELDVKVERNWRSCPETDSEQPGTSESWADRITTSSGFVTSRIAEEVRQR